jgi:hypothetical protein
VLDGQVSIFHLIESIRVRDYADVHHILQLAPTTAGKPNGNSRVRPGHFDRIEHVRRVAARADSNNQVTDLYQVRQLLCKNVVV